MNELNYLNLDNEFNLININKNNKSIDEQSKKLNYNDTKINNNNQEIVMNNDLLYSLSTNKSNENISNKVI